MGWMKVSAGEWALVASLLLVHAVLVVWSSRQNFVTVDEPGYFAAGIAHWETGSFALYRVNPPLPRMLAVLPALAARPATDYHNLKEEVPGDRSEWRVATDFVSANGARYFDLLCLARLAGAGWSVLGGWLVYRWARELYGALASYLSLAIWCFGPNVLGHAQVMTPDVPATVAGLAATYVFWRYLRAPSWRLAYFAGVLLGVAELTKFTLLVLYGAWPILWLAFRLAPPGEARARMTWKAASGQLVLILLLSVYVINLGYGFKESGAFLKDLPFVSRLFAGDPPPDTGAFVGGHSGNRFSDSWLGSLVVPLPADYLRGIDEQRRDFEAGWRSYLAGEWRTRGWWYYYLYALAVKVPLGVWGLVLWGLALSLCIPRWRACWRDELALWLPTGAVLALVSSQTGFNHHMRYVLPLFPFVIIATGKAACSWAEPRSRARWLVLALLLWGMGSSLAVYPHTLSYFNEAAGGPQNGSAHLVDSNIDWGQDLLFLKAWLDEHPEARPLGLAYFNVVDPRIVGIEFSLPPRGPNALSPPAAAPTWPFGPSPGYFAVSVNYLRGMSFSAPDGQGRQRMIAAGDYEYFCRFRPVARAGYSLFVYHITPEEANVVRRQLGLDPVPIASLEEPPP